MILIKLFIEFIKIGAFSFGGGLATLPHIYDLSEKTEWFTKEEVTNMITISQITPGPLACNTATYVGVKVGGVLGSIIANISFMIPAIIFTGMIYKVLDRWKDNPKIEFVISLVRATAFATIIYGSLSIFKMTFLYDNYVQYKSLQLAIIIFVIGKKKKIPVWCSMIFSGIMGVLLKF